MKSLKKFTSVLLALVMALGLTCTAFATDYTITINNTASGYQYTAYQIVSGDVSTLNSKYVLTNLEWGSGLSHANFDNAFWTKLANIKASDGSYPFTDNGSELRGNTWEWEIIWRALESCAYDDVVLQQFAELMYSYMTDSDKTTYGYTSTWDGSSYTITVDEPGYYLIETTTAPEDGAYTRYILVMVVDENTAATVNDKSAVPTIDKAVSNLDVNIGDTVTYYLAATLPTEYASYTTYQLNFYDTLSAGLTYTTDSVVVKVFDSEDKYKAYLAYKNAWGVDSSVTAATSDTSTTVASGYTATIGTYNATTGTAITISITDTNALKDGDGNTITVTKDSIIAVEFTATLNSSAVIGDPGNPNEVYLTYSNNPYNSSSTGKTVKDIVYTWTYALELTKTNASGSALEGAEFKLYRITDINTDEKEYAVINTDTGIVTKWTTDETEATVLTTDSDGKLKITGDRIIGLDASVLYNDGATITKQTIRYYLTEITAPTGYNLLDGNIEIEITPTYTQSGETDLTNDYITLSNLTATCMVAGNNVTSYPSFGSIDYSKGVSDGLVSFTITNYAGFNMPSTGGIGTTIFYVVGGVLVVGAVVLLITRKRMGD